MIAQRQRHGRRPGVRLRASLLVLACITLGGLEGCRCNEETLAPVVFDTDGDREPIDANRVLVPPWQPPTVTQLDNGALVHWLRDDAAQAFHVRVLLPTSVHAEKLEAAGTDAVIEALELRLGSRLRRIPGATLNVRSRPGRVELALHGRDADAPRLLKVLSDSFADAGSPKLLSVAQGKVLARHGRPDAKAQAAAGLAAELLGHPLGHELASKQDIVELSKGRLDRSWSTLTDPRDALLVIHSGRDPEDETETELREALDGLGDRWKGPLGFGSGKPAVTVRLRGAEPEFGERETFLLTETAPAPMFIYRGVPEAGGRAEVLLGRLIPTPTREERTLARLCQRIMQEKLDARLVVAGPVSLFAVRVRISPSDPVRSLQRIIERMQAFSATPQTTRRLDQAAELWLGARIVEASLQGEDWTSLWSESIDLAGEDREIYSALARDAQGMLEADPAQVQAFFSTWMDPQGGEPGWTWVGAGINDGFVEKLGASLTLVEAGE